MIGIYLSGTGNSKHCVEKFVQLLDKNGRTFPIENPQVIEEIKNETDIVVGYPTQFSNAPLMVRDFIRSNRALWEGKRIFCINTMGAFSGDGTGCTARLFRKYGATVTGGLQIKMPDSVCDSKLLKKTAEARLMRRMSLGQGRSRMEITQKRGFISMIISPDCLAKGCGFAGRL